MSKSKALADGTHSYALTLFITKMVSYLIITSFMAYPFKSLFSICRILLIVLAAGSCTCGPNESAGPNEPAGSTYPQQITILLCTANVEDFRHQPQLQPADVLKSLAGLRQETDDLVFIGLQETFTPTVKDIAPAFPGYEVYDYRGKNANHANTLVVFNKLRLKIVPAVKKELPIPQGLGRRYVTILHLPDINLQVTNTHILGGRFDDAGWYLYPNARHNQIKAILAHVPTIVMGDFNADNNPNAPFGTYLKDVLQKGLQQYSNRAAAEQALRYYMYSVHTELAQQGYVPLLTKKDIGYTIKRGKSTGMVDWIYATQKFANECKIVERGVVRAIDQNLSDHDFPWVRIRMKVAR